jgi:hypothetical protein
MHQIIAPTLFQNKICKLPGIGTLQMIYHSAQTDFVNGLIKSPTESIDFIAAGSGENEFNEFSALSDLIKKSLYENGSFFLQGIGTFLQVNEEEVKFEPIVVEAFYSQPVHVERVIRQDVAHPILVGDQQSTNIEMAEYLTGQPSKSNRWAMWAFLLFVIGVFAVLMYFFLNGNASLGNLLDL